MGYRRTSSAYSSLSSESSRTNLTRRSSPYSSGASTVIAKHQTYNQIKHGLRESNPAAIVLWAFHQISQHRKSGVTSRRVINFIKQHFKAVDDPRKTGKKVGAMLRCAVDFGLVIKRGNKYFIAAMENYK